jgi:hypothetical protein
VTYRRRAVDDELDEFLVGMPAILLDGPKGVGKTSTAKRRASTVIALDVPSQLQIAEADPDAILDGISPTLIDEWQRFPPIWDAVKRNVDDQEKDGVFLLTGSAYVPDAKIHSGSLRIHELRMRPMSLPERGVVSPTISLGALLRGEKGVKGNAIDFGLREYVKEIAASGFPGIRNMPSKLQSAELGSYLTNIVTKDFVEAGYKVRKPAALLGWIRAYAAATSTNISFEKIRGMSLPGEETPKTKITAATHIEVLKMLRIIDEVPAWLPGFNFLAQLAQAPKRHLVDPALAVRALGLNAEMLLNGEQGVLKLENQGNLLGRLFESLVTLSIKVFAQTHGATISHLRTRRGEHEVDLILETEDRKIIGIEVKLSPTVVDDDVKHLLWLRNNARTEVIDLIVITTGDTAFRRPDGVAVIPLALLGM